MILFKVDPDSIPIIPFKSDTPRTVDVDAITPGSAAKGMKIATWYFEVSQGLCVI
jgi:hypothetical protein